MLIAKYEQTYLQKNNRTINDGGIVSGVGGVFSGLALWCLCETTTLPSLKAQAPRTSLDH